jgi:hypothetical protein
MYQTRNPTRPLVSASKYVQEANMYTDQPSAKENMPPSPPPPNPTTTSQSFHHRPASKPQPPPPYVAPLKATRLTVEPGTPPTLPLVPMLCSRDSTPDGVLTPLTDM